MSTHQEGRTTGDAPPSTEASDSAAYHPLPILLLATANDRSVGGRPLRNLPDERRRISQVLEDRVEVTLLPDAMTEEVFRAFAHKNSSRIRIFHFAGHANASWLAFQTEEGEVARAGAKGLTSFLRRQESLVLVFLNGCSTEQQATLLREGVRAVIGTTEIIQDHVAARFAAKFYESLAYGTLAESYENAKSFIMAGSSDDPRNATREFEEAPDPSSAPQWPWFLYCDDASKTWRIDQPPPPRDLDVYRDRLRSFHRDVSFPHRAAGPHVTACIDDLYVPIPAAVHHGSLARRRFGEGDESSGPEEEVPIERAFPVADDQGTRGILVLGGPGSGKTWYLRRLLVKLLDDGPAALGLPESTVPIFLPLRRLDDSQTLFDFIESELARAPIRMSSDFPKWLWRRGKLLLVLDGLDEVTHPEHRKKLARWLAELRSARKDIFVLVSARFSGCHLDDELDEWFLALRLRPMNDDLVRGLVRSWYDAAARVTVEGSAARSRADAVIETLLGLRDEPGGSSWLRTMVGTPLLLRTICAHDIGRRLGTERRVELLQEAISMLLERRRTQKHLPITITARDAQRVLQAVAWWMHRRRRLRARASELEGPLTKAQQELSLPDVTPHELLRSIRDETGVLVEAAVDELELSSLGFQEYLAAREILDQVTTGELDEDGDPLAWLANGFGDDWQREVILHVRALAEPDVLHRFLTEVVRQPNFPLWAESPLMDACWKGSPSMVQRALVELIDSPDLHLAGAEHLLAVLRSLARRAPTSLVARDESLRSHPSPELRAWWQRHADEVRRSQPFSSLGGSEMVPIPGGRFFMGARDGLGEPMERPRHEVELSSFFLARTPVTNAQYARYLAQNPNANKPAYQGNEDFDRPDLPVVGISWDDAYAYCEWAGLSLPTEAQWEYACRGGVDSYASEHDLMDAGWYRESSALQLKAVAQKAPNAFGLYDMHGNVQEWCRDGWGEYSSKPPRAGDGLRYEPEGSYRVIRGGSSFHDMADARATTRRPMDHTKRQPWLGFRPALNLPESSSED